VFFHLGKSGFGVSWVSFQSFKMSSYSILEFSGLILNVTYFSCLFMSNMLPIALFPVMDFACVPLASFGFSFLVVIEIGSLPDRYTLLDPTFPYWNSSTFSSATKNSWIYLPEQIAGNINFELFIFWRCRCRPWTPRLPPLLIAPSWFVHCRVPPPVPPHFSPANGA